MTEGEPGPVDPERVRIGVSACLVGDPVRYDGRDKRDPVVADTLAAQFELVPFCPEAAIGLGVPREPIHLRGDPAQPRAAGNADPTRDVAAPLEAEGRRVGALDGLSGYVLKQDSPWCGVSGVPVHPDSGAGSPAGTGTGRYAAALRATHPLLPVEEEGRLQDPAVLEQFVLRVAVYHRWQCLRAAGPTPAALERFQAEHKYLLLAHDPARSRRMGRLVSDAGRGDLAAIADAYARALMAALAEPPSRRAHYNALQHAAGHLRGRIPEDDRAAVNAAIERFVAGEAPLSEPLALLREHAQRAGSDWLARQRYLAIAMGEPAS